MAHLWNLNAVSTLLVLTIGTGCVLGDYKPSSDYTTHRGRPTGPFCENLSPQHYIDMEHVRNYLSIVCGRWRETDRDSFYMYCPSVYRPVVQANY